MLLRAVPVVVLVILRTRRQSTLSASCCNCMHMKIVYADAAILVVLRTSVRTVWHGVAIE